MTPLSENADQSEPEPVQEQTEDEKILDKVYAQDPDTRAYIIEIDLDRYEDVFNEWDPAPFKRRDLDPDLREYLQESSEDIPVEYPISLRFTAPTAVENSEKEKRVKAGVRNSFLFEKRLIMRKLRKLTLRLLAQTAVAVGLLILVHLLVVNVGTEGSMWLSILQEGLTIGAWVFAWDAIATFAFERVKIHGMMMKWNRFCEARIEFEYRDRRASVRMNLPKY